MTLGTAEVALTLGVVTLRGVRHCRVVGRSGSWSPTVSMSVGALGDAGVFRPPPRPAVQGPLWQRMI